MPWPDRWRPCSDPAGMVFLAILSCVGCFIEYCFVTVTYVNIIDFGHTMIKLWSCGVAYGSGDTVEHETY